MDNNTLKQYFEMFTAAWKMFRAFKELRTDEDRERLKCAAEQIYQKYPEKIMRNLIWVIFDELDRLAGVKNNGK
ncbi:MAG: hypothetical protein KH828_07740 [Clostridiales bacterium]|nr:hypothetical protein [Clostridiales bacterium]